MLFFIWIIKLYNYLKINGMALHILRHTQIVTAHM